ncbi:hypothetical protein N7526_006738 [Penicillium atrosanguineum]|nr:hypothetical protein N7526_006738 [Penicillium atrosanguineum]
MTRPRVSHGVCPPRSRSSFSGFSADRGKGFWDTEREQLHHHMAHIKKSVSEDPYCAIFGRRLDSYCMDKQEHVWPGFLRSFLNIEPAAEENPSKAHLQDFNFVKSPQPSADGYQYDPISGRMAPMPPKPVDTDVFASVECPPGSEVEAKLASEPLVKETAQKPRPESVDCTGGSELEALFTADPASFKEAQVMAKVPHGQESIVKPNIHVDCSPGNELDALFVSESRRTEQPGAETIQVPESEKKLDPDSGLSSCVNFECAPGHELEAMFAAHPAAQEDQSRPLDTFDAQPASSEAGVSVDCPPGNELDVKFASTLAGLDSQTASVTEDATPTVDCSPGNELEAKIVSESMSLGTTLDCPPGSELEAKFIADPASAEHAPFQTAPTAEHATTRKCNVNIDCTPGSELEALFMSDAASTGARSPSVSEVNAKAESHKSNLYYEGTEDRVGDSLKETQKTPSQWSTAEYRILAYDSSISKISASEADSFFGTASTTAPEEILARLHNPAKFVPYFQQMQIDGYGIATGGGDILVFRRSAAATTNNSPSAAATTKANQEIANSIRHDSYPTSHSTFQVPSDHPLIGPSPPGSSSPNSKPKPRSKPGIFSRVLFLGTVTAASCYAIGVVTEFFRTGGVDGKGVDGFTVFESDRRRE